MNTDQMMNALYLGLLAAAIGGSYIVSNRDQMGKMLQQGLIWALIFVGVIAGIGVWDQVKQTVQPQQSVISDSQIVVPKQQDGHFYLTLDINDVAIDFVVDTGASQVVLTQDDARRIGIDPAALAYIGTASTANGLVRTAPVRLGRVALGPIQDRDVPAVVNQGDMEGSLLGMSYLGAFASVEIRGDQLFLTR